VISERRVIVACINWNQPAGVPRAVSYALWDGEMKGACYHATWRQAMDRAFDLAKRLRTSIHIDSPKEG
jgi:hypothetical protein